MSQHVFITDYFFLLSLTPTVEGGFPGVELVVKLSSSLSQRECVPVTWLSLPSGVSWPGLTSPPLIFLRVSLYVGLFAVVVWCE